MNNDLLFQTIPTPPPCLSTSTPATFPSHRKQDFGATTSVLWKVTIVNSKLYSVNKEFNQAMLTSVPPLSPVWPTGTPPSPRLSPPPTQTSGRSLASWSLWCGEDAEEHQLLQLVYCLMLITGEERLYYQHFTIHLYFRIHTIGYDYCPVHTEIYGSYRNQAARGVY